MCPCGKTTQLQLTISLEKEKKNRTCIAQWNNNTYVIKYVKLFLFSILNIKKQIKANKLRLKLICYQKKKKKKKNKPLYAI